MDITITLSPELVAEIIAARPNMAGADDKAKIGKLVSDFLVSVPVAAKAAALQRQLQQEAAAHQQAIRGAVSVK